MRQTPRLTPRQLEVLILLTDGLTDRQIAERLGISTATARTHVERVRHVFGVTTRADAVERARQLGIVGKKEDGSS